VPLELHPEAKCYHQQYLKKNRYGYCPGHGTGVSCPIGLGLTTGTGVNAEAAES
jgi:peptide-methionine (S)-S-oxide reductase